MSQLRFVFSEKTKALIPMLDENGHAYTKVLHGNKWFDVPVSTLQLIDQNLKFYFSSLRGAKESAKEKLNNADFFPIVIPVSPPLVFVSTAPFSSGKNIFIGLHQINSWCAYDEQRTTIHFYGGQSMTLPIPLKKLERRLAMSHHARSIYFQQYYKVERRVRFQLHINIIFDGFRLKLEE